MPGKRWWIFCSFQNGPLNRFVIGDIETVDDDAAGVDAVAAECHRIYGAGY
ncbi:MAG: hypothetical protein HY391_05700 [Deltaproteobacteria bacterium]|nr:hypothetical protein [Deltaproteobacteria bacterium]